MSSSLFRSPLDDSSSSSSDESSSDSGYNGATEDGEVSNPVFAEKQANAVEAEGTSHEDKENRSDSQADSGPGLEKEQKRGHTSANGEHKRVPINGHLPMLTASLLESYCLHRAVEILNDDCRSKNQFTTSSSEARLFARQLYESESQTLSNYGLIPRGSEGDEWAPFRQNYRDNLDRMGTMALHSSATSTPHNASRPGTSDSARIPLHRRLTDKNFSNTSGKGGEPMSSAEGGPGNSSPWFARFNQLSAIPLYPRLYPATQTSRYATEFEELKMLGRGSFGAVYQTKHHVDGQMYAVKKISLSHRRMKALEGGDLKGLENILKEIRTLARLEHRNVVRYYGAWVEYSQSSRDSPSSPFFEKPYQGSQPALLDSGAFASDDMSFNDVFGHDDKRHDIIFEEDSVVDDNIVFENSSNHSASDKDSSASRKQSGGNSLSTTNGASSGQSARRESDFGDEVESIPRSFNFQNRKPLLQSSTIDESTEDLDIFTDGMQSGHIGDVQKFKDQEEPMVTLHIQMSLHPLSLAKYLSTQMATPAVPSSHSTIDGHCYHVIPSVQLLLGILDGVQYLHSSGIVHRDLKPANIFLCNAPSYNQSLCAECEKSDFNSSRPAYNTPRIGDFGLVAEIKQNSPQEEPTTHHDQKPVGTEFYRPPRVSTPGSGEEEMPKADESLDIYALGVIFFELLYKFDTRMERQMVLSRLTCSGSSSFLTSEEPSAPNHPALPPDFAKKVNHVIKRHAENKSKHGPGADDAGDRSDQGHEVDVLDRLTECIYGMVSPDPRTRWTGGKIRENLLHILSLEN